MRTHYTTDRLLLDSLTSDDAEFILELVNTAGWLRFIGDRNIRTVDDARAYVQRILDNPHQQYRVARLRTENIPIGVITSIKKDYLEHHDIGFAFLPQYAGKGYAHEAAVSVMNDVMNDPAHKTILATTVKDNNSSIKHLERLGLRFEKQIKVADMQLLVYAVSRDKFLPRSKMGTRQFEG